MTLPADEDRAEFTAYFSARREVVRRAAYLFCGDWHTADDLAPARQRAVLICRFHWDLDCVTTASLLG